MAITENRLAITADDYGPHPFINDGILDAVEKNKVTSVGVLPNNYDSDHGVYDCAKQVETLISAIGDNNIGVGVHLSISSGKPLVPHKKLFLENGFFQNIRTFDFGIGKKHKDAIKAEIKAQIKVVKDVLDRHGKKIDHVSSHQSLLTLFTPYHYLMLEVLDELSVTTTIRNPMPISKHKDFKDDFGHSIMKAEGTKRALQLADNNLLLDAKILAGISFKRQLKKREDTIAVGHACPLFLFDNYYGQPKTKELNRIFRPYEESDEFNQGEIVVHLGKGNAAANRIYLNGINTNYFATRGDELTILNAYHMEEIAEANKIKICPMGDFS